MVLLLKDLEQLFREHRICVRNSLHHPNLYLLHKGERFAYVTVRGKLAVVTTDSGRALNSHSEVVEYFDQFRSTKAMTGSSGRN